MVKLINDPALRIQNLSAIEVERIEPLDIPDLLRTIWRGKFLALATASLFVLAAGYYAFAVASPQFAATTTLKVETDADPLTNPELAVTGLGTDNSALNTEVTMLQSRHLLGQVSETLELETDPAFNRYLTPIAPWSITGIRNDLRDLLSGQKNIAPDAAAIREKTIENLAETISVQSVRDTYIFEITATTGDPATSAQVANALAQAYLDDQIIAKQAVTARAFDWLAARVYDLQLELESKETAVNDLIVANRAHDAAALDALSRQSMDTKQRLRDVRRALGDAEAKLNGFGASVTNAALSDRQRLEADVQRFVDQAAALEIFLGELDSQLASQSASLITLQQLQREANATRVLYETFLARLRETSVQRELHHADSRILAPATAGKYVAPRKILILLIAGALGLTLGILLVLGRKTLRKGITTTDMLTDLTGLPVLAQIPRLQLRKPGRLLDHLNAKPSSATSEAIRNLRTSLLLADPGNVPQVILSTSSVAGEGKTTQSIALAHNLAGMGKSVLLVEADIRQPGFNKYLDCTGRDLDPLLRGDMALEDVVSRDRRLGADILPGHPTPQNPADRFASPQFASFVAELRKTYDFIILDAPPVLPVPDARILAQYSDAIIYAVRWDKTDQRLVVAGKRALSDVNATITGTVLAQVDTQRLHHYGGVYMGQYGKAYFQN